MAPCTRRSRTRSTGARSSVAVKDDLIKKRSWFAPGIRCASGPAFHAVCTAADVRRKDEARPVVAAAPASLRNARRGNRVHMRDLLYGLNLECPRIASTDLDDLTCKTPLAMAASGLAAQRITSVAWKRRIGEIVRPSASAALRLITSSNVVGCSIGRSAGLAPLRILST